MNKITMAVGAAALCGSVFAEGITSGVVGYSTGDYTGKQLNCITFPFANVGGDGQSFKLKDINADQFDDGSDTLQFLEPTAARTEKTYFAYDGNWFEGDWVPADDDQFDMGTGFLGNFASQKVKLTSAGSVLAGATEMDFTGKKMVMVGNPIPRAVKFSEIEPVSFDDGSDTLQKLESTRARTIKTYFAYNGDWYEGDWVPAENDEFAAGEAMLGNFGSGKVQLRFPGAL